MNGPGWLSAQAFAHRGLHGPGIPENSLASFDAAISHGYGVELDVQMSADGVPMVFHDRSLQRMTGLNANVASLPARDLERLHLHGTGEPIPTLEHTLAVIADRAPVLIEIKNETTRPGQLEEAVAQVVSAYSGRAGVMSWNVISMAWLHRHHPGLVRGLVVTSLWGGLSFSRNPWLLAAAKSPLVRRAAAQFLAHDVRHLPSALSKRFRKAGKPVVTWTVRTEGQLAVARTYADQPVFEGEIERLLRAPGDTL